MSAPLSWDIFCAVVDNYGDIGVCWRLARQLAAEYGFHVRLWVDDLGALRQICPDIDVSRSEQPVRRVEVRSWVAPFPRVEPADVVIEAFGCQLPAVYVDAMATRPQQPAWINLEYLSAESWIEGCHGLPSPHPRLRLTKHFYFPGFTLASGGLLAEKGLLERRRAFRSDARGVRGFWRSLGLPPAEAGECRISLFGYENAAVPGLLEEWSRASTRITCLVPEGRLLGEVAGFFGSGQAAAGDTFERGALRAHAMPFLEQERYDQLLWACDCNFVRGEDSFVRAQWAGHPFAWHIYPQDENAHWVKLEAFLDRYCAALPEEAADAVRGFWRAWNRGEGAGEAWAEFWRQRHILELHGERWAGELLEHGDLVANLVQFCKKKL